MQNDTSDELTLVDVAIEAMPFADQLIAWCHKHPDFKEGLKFANPDGFLAMGAVLTSHPKNCPQHEVIGFLAYDLSKDIFKQDYILNVDGGYQKFILYSKVPSKRYGPYVTHIKDFFSRYDVEGGYERDHHLTADQLLARGGEKFQDRVRSTLRLAQRIKRAGRNYPTQSELRTVLDKIRELKAQGSSTAP